MDNTNFKLVHFFFTPTNFSLLRFALLGARWGVHAELRIQSQSALKLLAD